MYKEINNQWVEIKSPQLIEQDYVRVRRNLSVPEMIAIGEIAWEIVKEGKPVVDFISERLGVLPKGVKSGSELAHWNKPTTSNYKVVYESFLGIEMVCFEYRLIFTSGGKYQGRGAYLNNVAIEPIDIEVAFGYDLNAEFEALDIVNLGSAEDPIAGLELKLTWTVETPIDKSLHQTNFFVSGNGAWEQL